SVLPTLRAGNLPALPVDEPHDVVREARLVDRLVLLLAIHPSLVLGRLVPGDESRAELGERLPEGLVLRGGASLDEAELVLQRLGQGGAFALELRFLIFELPVVVGRDPIPAQRLPLRPAIVPRHTGPLRV